MRETLLECALDHFGRLGFEGAATRSIAADCGTAMSSITYHFGGKEGLYLAVAEHIAGQIAQRNAPMLEAARAAPVRSPAEAVERLVGLLDSLAGMMLGETSARWARFITREQQEPTEAFDRLHSIAMQPLVETFIHLIALARRDLSDRECRATGFLMFGQVMAMRAGRASLMRILQGSVIIAEDEALIRARLAAHARAILAPPTAALSNDGPPETCA